MINSHGIPSFIPMGNLANLREELAQIHDNSLSDAEMLISMIRSVNRMGLIVGELADNWNVMENWIKGEGVDGAVKGLFNQWKSDGTLVKILNESALPQINQSVDNLRIQLTQAESRLNSAMRNLENNVNTTMSNTESSINAQNKAMWEKVQQEISNILTNGAITAVFTSADNLKSKYPQGAKGIFLTADTKHLWYWNDTAWVDGGAYFQPEIATGAVKSINIADKTIQDNNIGSINLDSILDSFAPISSAYTWNDSSKDSRIFIDKNNVVYRKNSDQPDTGIGFKVTIPDDDRITTVGQSLYVHYYYYTANANELDDKIDIWIADQNNKLLKQIYTGVKKSGTGTIELTSAMLSELGLTNKFNVIVALHGTKGTLDVDGFRVNYSNTFDFLPEAIAKIYAITDKQIKELNTNSLSNNMIKIDRYQSWGASAGNNMSFVNHGDWFEYTQTVDGDVGVLFPVSNYEDGKDLHVGFSSSISGATNVGEEIYLLSSQKRPILGSNKKLNNNFNLVSKQYHYTSQQLRSWGVNDNEVMLLFVTHKKGARLEVHDLNAGLTAGMPTLSETINEITASYPLRVTEKVGQEITDLNISKFTPIKVTGLQYVTPKTPVANESIITDIEAYVVASGNYTFATAKIDQNNLMVNAKHFTLDLNSGYNYLNVETKNISIGAGEQLFMLLDKDETIYKPNDTSIKHVPMLVQDTSHSTTDPSYSGYVMYDSGANMIPFAYRVSQQKQSDRVAELENSYETLNDEVSNILAKQENITLTKPDGSTVYLTIDMNNQLHVNSTVPNSVAYIGNSLLFEGNYGSIGLAASDPDHDYYSLVNKWIRSKNSSAKFTDRFSSAGWESATNSSDRQAFFDNTIKPVLTPETDLVIIQLIDNVNTPEKLATFEQDGETLVKNIRKVSQNARVLWVAGWFVDTNKINLVKQICDNTGATFVDITGYKDDKQYQSYIGAKRKGIDGTEITVKTQGEASHPGDLGMQKISEKIISAIKVGG